MADINLSSLKALIIFKTLYEQGTATRTARELGITQSGVSRSLGQLEENIGMALFMRHKKRLVPMPEADELYGEILRLTGNLEEMKHTIVALREFGASRMRLASAPALGFAYVPRLIANILRINPKYSIYFDIMPSPDVTRAVESGSFDAGFVTLPVNTQTLVVEELFSVKAVCLVPKNHPLADADVIDVKDLRGQHLVIPNQPNLAADQLLALINEKRIRIAGKTEANIAAICSLVANGVGISLINPITAFDNLAATKDFLIKPFEPTFHYSFGLVYRQSWAGNQLIDHLKKHLPDLPNL
ncbi:MAG: LysR family transcriptional regulator [Oceanospirillaceae bacterium]|uniref:LysR family transcriptional regulator n=1 Tax=Marinobacterium litorale TaxID=404770 RepID=UPI000425A602|nr:LysR family transcriptional regulator [Marinobacterium litorale]MBS97551.1 LysR family transcriptional regulator [Oceanospirillaceae bacterium]